MVPMLPRATLAIAGVLYALLGVAFAIGMIAGGTGGGAELLMIAVLVVVSLGMGVVNLVIARGLGDGRSWAWWGAMALAVLYVPSACLPFGLAIAIPLWDDDVKKHFGV